LSALDRTIAQRAQLRTQLMNLSQSDDITARLLASNQNDEEVYSTELAKYSEIQNKIQETFAQQTDLLNKIQQDNSQFIASKQSGNPNAQREQILQQLTTAFKVYNELKSNLREGIQFYTNFQEILRQFSRKCEDFAFARQTEKQDLISELQKQSNQPANQGFVSSPPPFTTTTQQAKPQNQPYLPQGVVPGQWQPIMQPVYQQPTPSTYQPAVTNYQQSPSAPISYQQSPSVPTNYQQPPSAPISYQQSPSAPTYQQPPVYQQQQSPSPYPYSAQQNYQQPTAFTPYNPNQPPYGQQPYVQPPYGQVPPYNQSGYQQQQPKR